jgi:hypothetical protein
MNHWWRRWNLMQYSSNVDFGHCFLMLRMESWGFSRDNSDSVATCLAASEMHEGHVSEKKELADNNF